MDTEDKQQPEKKDSEILGEDPRVTGIFETIIPLKSGAVQTLVRERLSKEEREYILSHRNVAEVLSMIAFNEGRSKAIELVFNEIQEAFPDPVEQPRLYQIMKTWGWLKNHKYSDSPADELSE